MCKFFENSLETEETIGFLDFLADSEKSPFFILVSCVNGLDTTVEDIAVPLLNAMINATLTEHEPLVSCFINSGYVQEFFTKSLNQNQSEKVYTLVIECLGFLLQELQDTENIHTLVE